MVEKTLLSLFLHGKVLRARDKRCRRCAIDLGQTSLEIPNLKLKCFSTQGFSVFSPSSASEFTA